MQLEALCRQTWEEELEVIVSDNGSTDGSREIATEFQSRLPGLRIVDASDHQSPGHARNAGAAKAHGEALLFCDADDEVDDDWLSAMVRGLSSSPMVASRYDADKLNSEAVRRIHPENPQQNGLGQYTYPPFLEHAGGGGLGVLRTVFEEAGGFDVDLPALEDTDLCWRVQQRGHSLEFVPDAVVHIRFRSTLEGSFRQALLYGEYNVLIYKRYRSRGMPRLPLLPGLAKWVLLVLRTPQLLSSSSRPRWIWQAGWRLGRLRGCLRYRTLGL